MPVQKAMKKTPKKEQEFHMPVEVKNWIEQADSRIRHLTSEVERLKKENADLKSYRKFAEQRILRSEAE